MRTDNRYHWIGPSGDRTKALQMLQRGATAWNAWISEGRYGLDYEPKDFVLDRCRANLEETDLRGVNLCAFDLRRVNLQGADLQEANLVNASLVDTHAGYANFSGAICRNVDFGLTYLSNTNFNDADCRWAQFQPFEIDGSSFVNADLRHASVRSADLSGVPMNGAQLSGTIFAACSLSDAVGLDECCHGGPSSIDIDTLMRSKGRLPELFLRGIGTPDLMIEYLPSLLGRPIQLYSCFISYSASDELFASRLHADLQQRGVRCWYAPASMSIGDRIRDRIDQSIRTHDKLIVILSRSSEYSDWVEAEVETAFERERSENRGLTANVRSNVIFPIAIDDVVDSPTRAWVRALCQTRNIGDFRFWEKPANYIAALERLITDLKRV